MPTPGEVWRAMAEAVPSLGYEHLHRHTPLYCAVPLTRSRPGQVVVARHSIAVRLTQVVCHLAESSCTDP